MPPPLTYAEVGATRGELPAGYHHVRVARVLGSGEALFDRAAEAVLSFDLQRRAGLRVQASTPRAQVGTEVTVALGIGPLAVTAPCRVVYVVDEPRCQGFAYGTLPGHPETGEESFVVRLDSNGSVVLEVTAFSRPATWWSRAGGPLGRLVQARVTRRYLRALDDQRGSMRS